MFNKLTGYIIAFIMISKYKGGFENLEAWKEARKLRLAVFQFIKTLPADEKYRLRDQLFRSSRSVTANIAEGYGRYHYQENIQFCRQARGSLTETMDHLICALDMNFIDQIGLDEFRKQYEFVLKLINGYIVYLKQRKNEI